MRERVGLFEQSSFAKLMVVGRDAVRVLNRIATANVDVAVGRCVYTQFLNAAAGIEADLTVTRLAPDRFLVVTAAFTQTHVESWIRNSISADSFCAVVDVSDAYAMLNVQGPSSRALLQELSSDDFSAGAFPFATCREVRIGYQTLLALRLTFVGELGWELYVPTSFALPVYDALIEAGAAHGLRHCGYHTLNSLRIEKAYRDWPHDIGPADTPWEAGLAFTCDWNKPGGFIGRDALEHLKRVGRSEAPAGSVPARRIRRRCCITTSPSIGTASGSASSPRACMDIRSARRWRSATWRMRMAAPTSMS